VANNDVAFAAQEFVFYELIFLPSPIPLCPTLLSLCEYIQHAHHHHCCHHETVVQCKRRIIILIVFVLVPLLFLKHIEQQPFVLDAHLVVCGV